MSGPHLAQKALEDPTSFSGLIQAFGEKHMIRVGGIGRDVGLQQLSHPEDATEGPLQVSDTVHHHSFSVSYQLLQHLK